MDNNSISAFLERVTTTDGNHNRQLSDTYMESLKNDLRSLPRPSRSRDELLKTGHIKFNLFVCGILSDFPHNPTLLLKVMVQNLSDTFSRTVDDVKEQPSYWDRFFTRTEVSDNLVSYPWKINGGEHDDKWMEVFECLPTFLYEYLLSSQHTKQRSKKRRRVLEEEKVKGLEDRYNACLGYLCTQLFLKVKGVKDDQINCDERELSIVILDWKKAFADLRLMLQNTAICGREQSSEWRLFHVGFLMFLLDGMVESTIFYEGCDERNEEEELVLLSEELFTENGYGRWCFLAEYGLELQGFDIPFMVKVLLDDNGMIPAFLKIANATDLRTLVAIIADTLITYSKRHITSQSTSYLSYVHKTIINLIENGNGDTSEAYIKLLSQRATKKKEQEELSWEMNRTGTKRKSLYLREVNAYPILIEIKAYLGVPRLENGIALIQRLDQTSNIPVEDKKQGWRLLLEFFHENDALLDDGDAIEDYTPSYHDDDFCERAARANYVSRQQMRKDMNRQFHMLTVSTRTGIQAILEFLQEIVISVMKQVQDATNMHGGGIAPEEEQWIQCYQLKVRKAALRFCISRIGFFSTQTALKEACQVSALPYDPEENEIVEQVNLILSQHVSFPPRPQILNVQTMTNDEGLNISDENVPDSVTMEEVEPESLTGNVSKEIEESTDTLETGICVDEDILLEERGGDNIEVIVHDSDGPGGEKDYKVGCDHDADCMEDEERDKSTKEGAANQKFYTDGEVSENSQRSDAYCHLKNSNCSDSSDNSEDNGTYSVSNDDSCADEEHIRNTINSNEMTGDDEYSTIIDTKDTGVSKHNAHSAEDDSSDDEHHIGKVYGEHLAACDNLRGDDEGKASESNNEETDKDESSTNTNTINIGIHEHYVDSSAEDEKRKSERHTSEDENTASAAYYDLYADEKVKVSKLHDATSSHEETIAMSEFSAQDEGKDNSVSEQAKNNELNEESSDDEASTETERKGTAIVDSNIYNDDDESEAPEEINVTNDEKSFAEERIEDVAMSEFSAQDEGKDNLVSEQVKNNEFNERSRDDQADPELSRVNQANTPEVEIKSTAMINNVDDDAEASEARESINVTDAANSNKRHEESTDEKSSAEALIELSTTMVAYGDPHDEAEDNSVSEQAKNCNLQDNQEIDTDELSTMSYRQLQQRCKAKGLSTRGKGEVLKSRLLDSVGESKKITDVVSGYKEENQEKGEVLNRRPLDSVGEDKITDVVSDYKGENQEIDADELSTMSYRQLQQRCKAKGLSTRGKGEALKSRLLDSVGKNEITDAVSSYKEENQEKVEVLNRRPLDSVGEDKITDVVWEIDADELSTMSYRQLQQRCKAKGLSAGGKAAVLKSRLLDASKISIKPSINFKSEIAMKNEIAIKSEIAETPNALKGENENMDTAATFMSPLGNFARSIGDKVMHILSPKSTKADTIDLHQDHSEDEDDDKVEETLRPIPNILDHGSPSTMSAVSSIANDYAD